MTIKIGIHGANVGALAGRAGGEAVCQAVSEFGLESVWAWEQVVIPANFASPWPYSSDGTLAAPEDIALTEPLSWLSWIGAQVPDVKLGTGVALLPLHHPAEFAKTVATVDLLTSERVILGVGVGWLAEEYDVLGKDFTSRGKRANDSIRALRTLWSQSPAAFDSETISFPDLYCEPRPRRQIPIVVAGGSRAAAIRAGRLGDGFYPHATVSDLDGLIATMREAAVDASRDPDEIELTLASEGDVSNYSEAKRVAATRYLINVGAQTPESLQPFLAQTLDSLKGL